MPGRDLGHGPAALGEGVADLLVLGDVKAGQLVVLGDPQADDRVDHLEQDEAEAEGEGQ